LGEVYDAHMFAWLFLKGQEKKWKVDICVFWEDEWERIYRGTDVVDLIWNDDGDDDDDDDDDIVEYQAKQIKSRQASA